MRVAIHQPNFAPWCGWFAKMLQADLMILLDDVQFERGGWTNRTLLPDGLLTVPVHCTYDGKILPINEVNLKGDARWYRKTRSRLQHRYGKSPGGEWIIEVFDLAASRCHELHQFNAVLLDNMNLILGIRRPGVLSRMPLMVWASEVRFCEKPEPGTKGLIQLLKAVGATVYVCGEGSYSYQDDALIEAEGIEVRSYRYERRKIEYSALDLIARHSVDAGAILRERAV